MTPESCANGTERCAPPIRHSRGDRHRGEPPGRRAADPALVRHRHRPRLAPTPGPPWRRRWCAPRRWFIAWLLADQAARPRRRHDGGGSMRGATRAISPSRSSPMCREQAGRSVAAGLPPHRRLCLSPRGTLPPMSRPPYQCWRSWRGWSSSASSTPASPVAMVEVDPEGRDMWELNNPEDVVPIEAALAALGIA